MGCSEGGGWSERGQGQLLWLEGRDGVREDIGKEGTGIGQDRAVI